jgi:hypothetical protein
MTDDQCRACGGDTSDLSGAETCFSQCAEELRQDWRRTDDRSAGADDRVPGPGPTRPPATTTVATAMPRLPALGGDR